MVTVNSVEEELSFIAYFCVLFLSFFFFNIMNASLPTPLIKELCLSCPPLYHYKNKPWSYKVIQ